LRETTVRVRTLLLFICWLVFADPAPAQNVVVFPGVVGGAAPAQVGGVPTAGAPVYAALVAEGGPPGSQEFVEDPLAGPLFGDNLRIDLGFEYLRPQYTNGATTLIVPPNAASAFPVRGTLGDVTHDFAFIPRFGIQYAFPNSSGFGVGASGKLFTLQGDLNRTVTGPTGSGVLNASDAISIGSANVLEGLYRFNLRKYECFQDTALEDLTLVGSLGGRYAYVRQDFTASLTSGANLTSLTATQDFTGFGITASLGSLYLIGDSKRFGLYTLSRGSVLAGRNDRSSTFATVLAAGGSTSGQATERVTKLLPVGEFEVGISYGLPLKKRAAAGVALPPILWFRTGVVAQVWGGMGLPPPPVNASLQGGSFSNTSLFLYGFTVLAGFSY
jgi:hypothetical protein